MGLKNCLIAFGPSIVATVALICGTAGTLYCETMQFPQEGSDAVLFVGPWAYRTRDYVDVGDQVWVIQTCRSYSYLKKDLGFDYELDSKARTVMAFSILATFVGSLAVIFAVLATCSGKVTPSRWKGFGNIFFFVVVLQGLSLLLQSSSICSNNPVIQFLDVQSPTVSATLPEDCEWGPGYRLIISSVVMWFVAGVLTYVMKCPEIDDSEPPQSQTVTYQQHPDGRVEETHVQVVKGTAVETEEKYKE